MEEYYPIILRPTATTLPSSITKTGKTQRVGASEIVCLSHIFSLNLGELRENVCVNIDGHRYEPDFAYIDEARGIYVDIEVDEPYTSRGKSTHYINDDGSSSDSMRNHRFQNAGWYVFRFSEKQFFCHTDRCLKTVYDLLVSEGLVSELPKKLKRVSCVLFKEKHWNYSEGLEMSRSRYRRSYLGFDPVRYDLRSQLSCCWLLIPVMFQSIWNKRMRSCMGKHLYYYFMN